MCASMLSLVSLFIGNPVLRRLHHPPSNLQLERSAQLALMNQMAMTSLSQGIFFLIPLSVELVDDLPILVLHVIALKSHVPNSHLLLPRRRKDVN